MGFMDLIKKHLKTIVTAILAVVGNAIYDLIEGRTPFPTTSQEWTRWGLTVGLAAVGAYLPRNAQSETQVKTAVEKDLNPEERVAVAEDTLDRLPVGVRQNVLDARRGLA